MRNQRRNMHCPAMNPQLFTAPIIPDTMLSIKPYIQATCLITPVEQAQHLPIGQLNPAYLIGRVVELCRYSSWWKQFVQHGNLVVWQACQIIPGEYHAPRRIDCRGMEEKLICCDGRHICLYEFSPWPDQPFPFVVQYNTIGIVDPQPIMLPAPPEALSCNRRDHRPSASDIPRYAHTMNQAKRGPHRSIAAQDKAILAGPA